MGGVLRRERERERAGLKTNPLCELVLVAMVTIITSHLGEQEQEGREQEERGVGGGERKRKRPGWELLRDEGSGG